MKYRIDIIMAIAEAAERVGGIDNLDFPGRRKTWHTSTANGLLYYNNRETGSTGTVNLKK